MAIKITKTNGTIADYDEKKVRASIKKSGADKKTIDDILQVVNTSLKPRMKTAEIYKIVREELKKRKPWAAARYDLRAAIFRLGPYGFNFEKYVAAVLTAYGYKTELPDYYKGACIPHEIDVTAEKEGRTAFIEAKFRHDFSASITIKDTLATWARFLDLVDGSNIGTCPHFDEAWIVTNARFTDQSLKYGHCKNMKLIGWNHPKERSFAQMVDLNALYPLTIIQEISKYELEIFANVGLMLCREFLEITPKEIVKMTGIKLDRIKEIAEMCQSVIKAGK